MNHTNNHLYSTAYKFLVEKLSHKVDRTRSDVKKIAKRIPDHEASPTPSTESVAEAEFSDIPLHPRQEDYPAIEHWTPEKWRALRHPPKGTTPQVESGKINTLFWEDPSGNVIPPLQRQRVTQDQRSIWQDMHEKGKRLGCITKIGWDVRQEYRTRMEQLHPWLRLCRDHWKVDQLWSNHFSGWVPAGESRQGRPENLKRERSVEEDEAGPSQKKLKTPAQRPKPTKKPTVKVSRLLCIRRTHCH